MGTMHALRAHTRGGPDVLVYEHAPTPIPQDGEVLIEVHAAAITFAELTWEETWTRNGIDRTPTIPSHEFSGVVTELGDRALGVTVGQEVYGLIPFDHNGAAAEYVSAPTSTLAAKPASLSHVEAAALPLAALTAWQALVDHAKIRSGERVLIHGGAGGVGGYATQIAAARGARTTVTSRGQVDYVKSLGAQTVIDARSDDFDTEPGVFDVVIDTVGGQTLARSFRVLRRGGRLITLQEPPDQDKAAQYGIDATFFIVTADRDGLTQLAGLVDSGSLRVTVAKCFPLADGAAAYASATSPNRVPGKTVLTVRGTRTTD
jgi:NADPH:quinone reductase-like Zn-dependent oxidoreductase